MDGQLYAELAIGDSYYHIYPISSDKQILVKIVNSDNGTLNPDIGDGSTNYMPESLDTCILNLGSCTIDLYIAYTPSLAAVMPMVNLLPMTRMMLSQLNITYLRSKVKHCARIVEVAKLIDIGWTDKPNSNTEINQLKPLVIGPSDLNTRVNNVKADLMVLLTTGNNWPADEHGIAFKCATPPCTIVKFNSATDRRYTFTHEVGHLLCGGHEDDLTPFSKAYKDSANLFRTVIHQAPAESNRILNYSNPYVKYSSKTTGTKYQYNACVIQNSGCGMAGFNEPNECTIHAKGKFDSECNPTTIKVTASMLPTTCNAQNYKFEYTIDGFNYYTSCPFTPNNYCDISLLIFPNRSSITMKITAYGNGTQVIGYLFKTFTTICPETPMSLPGYL